MTQPTLYYDGSCGMCRREINHLRPRLIAHVELVDISDPAFEPPAGYTHAAMMERLHFQDGTRMRVGLDASIGYWRIAGGGFARLAALLGLPGVFQCGDWAYNRWAAWRLKRQHCALPR